MATHLHIVPAQCLNDAGDLSAARRSTSWATFRFRTRRATPVSLLGSSERSPTRTVSLARPERMCVRLLALEAPHAS